MRGRWLVTGAAAVLAAVACTSFDGVDDAPETTPDAAGADASDSGLTSDAPIPDDEDAGGVAMVPVTAPGGSIYYIDATEVTVREFARVSAAHPWRPKMVDVRICDAKTSWRSATGECTSATTAPDQPVNCVDWCAATAYCAAVGKHLCGKIGGGSTPPGSGRDPSVDEWTRACRGPKDQDQPYGPAYVEGNCNDPLADAGGPAPVGSFPLCEGGHAGLFDMVGNLNEWENLCFGPEDGGFGQEGCAVRGGAWKKPVNEQLCEHVHAAIPQTAYDDVGFRCCADGPGQ
ncbi:MAG: SUMF1/EgtB/PvdO family nonheme iron enzyme [Labilithrix sp.]|nr:SUMF1/EgtB/PvdO family nonheme iron enzyme [Labilithrix sp.]